MADVFWGGQRAQIETISGFTEVSSQHDRVGQLTKHQIEKGAKISDHMATEPDRLSLVIIVSDTPIDGPARPGYSIGIADQLRQLQADHVLMTVVTSTRTYDNMALVETSDPVDVNIGVNAKRITCKFEQATFVIAKTTAPILTSDPRGQRTRRTGTRATKALDFIPGANATRRAFNEAMLLGQIPGGNALWAARRK